MWKGIENPGEGYFGVSRLNRTKMRMYNLVFRSLSLIVCDRYREQLPEYYCANGTSVSFYTCLEGSSLTLRAVPRCSH
jgi:hypothetical protein